MVEKLGPVRVLPANGAGDEEPREPSRLRNADARGLGREIAFSRLDVGPSAHHVQLQLSHLLRRQEPVAVGRKRLEDVVQRTRHLACKYGKRILDRLLLRQKLRYASTSLLDYVRALVHGKLVADAGVEPRL